MEARAPAHAGRCYPLAGLLVAAVGVGAYGLALWLGLPPLAAGMLAVGATLLATGGLHEDGLADFADSFGGWTRERRLAIMRDSRIGAYGVTALVFSIGLRAAALAALPGAGACFAALLAGHALSRGLLPLVMATQPLARGDGLAVHTGKPGAGDLAWAVGLAALVALAALGLGGGVLALLLAVTLTLGLARLARLRLGGYTGDVLGAVQQVVEIAVLLLASVLRS